MLKYVEKIMLAWAHGKQHASSGSGSSDYYGTPSMTLQGNIIYSYDTPLAVIKRGIIYLNTEKYSRTTTNQQNSITQLATLVYNLKVKNVTENQLRKTI